MSPPHFRRTKTNAFYSRTHLPFAVTLQQLHPRTGRKEESIKKRALEPRKIIRNSLASCMHPRQLLVLHFPFILKQKNLARLMTKEQ